MPGMVADRRRLLQLVGIFGGSLWARSVFAAPCASSDGSDAPLRQSLHYAENSPNPAQRCSACGFFSEPQGTCGKCMIFNGPTNLNGHCDSWAARS